MSATNRTENYNLPIFIETDKPAWLVDFNGAMRSIDAQMKLNAEAIATKSPILTFQDTADIDFTKTGDIITANLQSAITDKVGRALVTPLTAPTAEQLVAIDTNGNQENISIGKGLAYNNGALESIDLDLTNNIDVTISGLPSGVTYTGGVGLKLALNAARTIGKIYGYFSLQATSAASGSRFYIDTGIDVAATGEEYYIWAAGMETKSNANDHSIVHIRVSETGRVSLYVVAFPGGYANIWLPPCLYFFKNFGDIVTP